MRCSIATVEAVGRCVSGNPHAFANVDFERCERLFVPLQRRSQRVQKSFGGEVVQDYPLTDVHRHLSRSVWGWIEAEIQYQLFRCTCHAAEVGIPGMGGSIVDKNLLNSRRPRRSVAGDRCRLVLGNVVHLFAPCT